MSYTRVQMNARDKALDLVHQGLIDPMDMLMACLQYMSADEVQDMLDVNCFEE